MDQVENWVKSFTIKPQLQWERIQRRVKVYRKKYRRLKREQVFQPEQFTTDFRYVRGKNVLINHRNERKTAEIQSKRNEYYTKFIGIRTESEQICPQISLSTLQTCNFKGTLREFRRPFGGFHGEKLNLPLSKSMILPKKWDSRPANLYIAQRKEQMLKCRNLSRMAILKVNTQEIIDGVW